MAIVFWGVVEDANIIVAAFENVLASIGAGRPFHGTDAFPLLDGILRLIGFFWMILIGQLLVQRILARS